MTSSTRWFLRYCSTRALKGIPFKLTTKEALESFLHWTDSNPLGIRLQPSSIYVRTLQVPIYLFEADILSQFEYEKTSMGRLFYQSLVNPSKTYHLGAQYIRGSDNYRYTCGNTHMQLYVGPEPLLGRARELYIPASEFHSLRTLTSSEASDAQRVCIKEDVAERYFTYRICQLERERISKDSKQRVTDIADCLVVEVSFKRKNLSCIYFPVYEISFCSSMRHFRYWMNGVTGMVSGDPIFSSMKTASYASAGCGLFCLLSGITHMIPDLSLEYSLQFMGISYIIFGFLAHLMSASQWQRSGMGLMEPSMDETNSSDYHKKENNGHHGRHNHSNQRERQSKNNESTSSVIHNLNYYDTLQVDQNATLKQIKASFYRLVLKYHPDRFPRDEACAEKMKEILEAYSVLGNPLKRAMYDRSRKQCSRCENNNN
ncbi:DNAJ heat shock protein, putative isoform 1 [Galdieria sulphuraria]|uniref:DNAJ heat shock protein, putative isoform 1 n=1 Tax=Galdieria sulphuraria TaxID=130081 RepID=M2XIE8_GALSU|nr:DNAJ heat shock protein, putative isoform 1 [Galdieria sulphuraria]EME29847.1 DNAJ heat shock protein, putative isoform 1 [Galdieria sulphuraria]|eukprot:XP_005706367.1 DNAJ heat shock protein, putative isoform 1 [Galdieria sulphuraria]